MRNKYHTPDRATGKKLSICLSEMFVFVLQPLQIKSVVAKESLKGYIYIEAYKQTHVKQAIQDVGSLKMGIWAQQVSVPHRGQKYFKIALVLQN